MLSLANYTKQISKIQYLIITKPLILHLQYHFYIFYCFFPLSAMFHISTMFYLLYLTSRKCATPSFMFQNRVREFLQTIQPNNTPPLNFNSQIIFSILPYALLFVYFLIYYTQQSKYTL